MDCPTAFSPSQAVPVAAVLPPRATRPKRPLRRPPVRVLVLLSPDGFAECYTADNVQIHITNRLAVEPQDEVSADRYLDSILPEPFKQLFRPRNLRASGRMERRSAEDEADRQHHLHLVRGMVAVGKERQAVPRAIQRARRAAG